MRPEWVTVNGGKVSIVAHDEYYRAMKRVWRQRLVKVHPDKRTARIMKARRPHEITNTCACGNVMGRGATTCQSCRFHKHLPAGSHPNGRGFLTVSERYRRWREQEARWYAQYDLLPPDQIGQRALNPPNAWLLAERYA